LNEFLNLSPLPSCVFPQFPCRAYPRSLEKVVKQSGPATVQSPAALKAGAALNKATEMTETKKENSNKKAQVLVLDTLNDLFNEATIDDEKHRPVSVAAVLVYSDGTTSSQMAGDMHRILLTGALTDLVNQIFFECRQREINEQVEKTVEALHLASIPTGGGSKPN